MHVVDPALAMAGVDSAPRREGCIFPFILFYEMGITAKDVHSTKKRQGDNYDCLFKIQ
jgi:hypothetical protein